MSFSRLIFFGLLAAWWLGGLRGAHGGQINWSSSIGGTHVTSGGQKLDGQFVFELGVFDAGFTPTAANAAEWAGKWHRAALAAYNPATSYYAGSTSVTSNAAPFSQGTKGWVWGHDGRCTLGEMVLLSAPTWVWPSQSNFELPVSWTLSAASQTIVGQINGGSFELKTAAVTALLPVTGWTEWQSKVFSTTQLQNPAISGPTADPDGDGRSNALEFALGGHPQVADGLGFGLTSSTVVADGRSRLAATFKRRCDRTFTPLFEVSLDLKTWTSAAGSTVTVSTAAETVTVREALTTATGAPAFIRVKIPVP